MTKSFSLTGQLTITTLLLGAFLNGCATGGNTGESADDPTEDQAEGEMAGSGANQGADTETTSEGEANLSTPLFTNPMPWTKDVSALAPSSQSSTIINWLSTNGGWGSSNLMKIDFSLTLLSADNATPKKSWTKTGDFYSPDCDYMTFPVPTTGSLEGESGYQCTLDGDCHFIVKHTGENKLYEMWRANIVGGVFYGGCTAVWDLTKAYSSTLRGAGCTSADAGGLPITALTPTADEVASGSVDHAIRFILPNARIRKMVYVAPATHSTFATTGASSAPPYGVRFRLKPSFNLANLPSNGARTIAKAMQKYGIVLSDGGNIALTFASDKYSANKWSSLGVTSQSLTSIKVTDFEVVDMGTPVTWNGDCVRNP